MFSARASKPLIIYGAGVQGCRDRAVAFAEECNVPVCLTWGAADLLPWDHPLRVGTFGTHGNKYANLAIHHADFILCVGSRLDTKATAFPVSAFAPNADIVMVDIDQAEIDKFRILGREVSAVVAGASEWLTRFPAKRVECASWLEQIAQWKKNYPAVPEGDEINPYSVVHALSDYVSKDDVVVSDTGCALAWMMQAYRFKGERFIHAFNQTPMGYGLPAAIGAAFATGKRVICVSGDGGLSVNITEMATAARHKLPLKVVLFNNKGHAMCRQTQRMWLGGEYPSTSYEGGLACPDFVSIASAYEWSAVRHVECRYPNLRWPAQLRSLMECDGPGLLELTIDGGWGVEGQVKFGDPLVKDQA